MRGFIQITNLSSGNVPKELLVEPDVFHTPTDHAIDHRRQTFHLGLPAGRTPRMKIDRPRPSSCSVLSISQTSSLRLCGSVSRDCRWNKSSSRRLQYPVKLRLDVQAYAAV